MLASDSNERLAKWYTRSAQTTALGVQRWPGYRRVVVHFSSIGFSSANGRRRHSSQPPRISATAWLAPRDRGRVPSVWRWHRRDAFLLIASIRKGRAVYGWALPSSSLPSTQARSRPRVAGRTARGYGPSRRLTADAGVFEVWRDRCVGAWLKLACESTRWSRGSALLSEAVPRLELFPFRYRHPVTGKWVRARHVATREEIAKGKEWEITRRPRSPGTREPSPSSTRVPQDAASATRDLGCEPAIL